MRSLLSIERYTARGYSIEVKENCLRMYVNGLGFRASERVRVYHNSVIRWVRKSALALPNAPEVEEIPEITEIDGEGRCFASSLSNRHVDELQTYVGQSANRCFEHQLNLYFIISISIPFLCKNYPAGMQRPITLAIALPNLAQTFTMQSGFRCDTSTDVPTDVRNYDRF